VLGTAICDLLGIEYPVFQGGMAHIATAKLVSAVSSAGGLGILGCGHNPPEWARQQVRMVRELTSNPFGVNILLTSPFADQIARVAVDEKVPVVTTGAGNPQNIIPLLKQAGIRVVPVVGDLTNAIRLEQLGADAIVAEGMEAGGHVGRISTIVLLHQVLNEIKTPVIAAGGFADGRGLAAALAVGASGVQMGTRFVCSIECEAHPLYKQKIVEAGSEDTIVTGINAGLPVRSLKNGYTDQMAALEQAGAGREAVREFTSGRTWLGIGEGDVDEGILLAGQAAGLIHDIKPAGQIVHDVVGEAEKWLSLGYH